MATQIFVNLPVKDLSKSVEFFTKLGFSFNARFTNEEATMMVIEENISVMLLVKKFFRTFTSKEISDAAKSTEVIVSLSADSREEVDEMLNKAIEAGAATPLPALEMEGMYGRSFEDLDGHHWEYMYMDMDPSAVHQG